MMDHLTISAPAKLNLALSAGAPNEDGLHPICSWMVTVSLYDDLELTRLPPDRFSRYAILWHGDAKRRREINWSVTKDLAVQAHLALQRYCRRSLPVQMKLEKRIPIGGGLGGGSSDAAAMLHGINKMYDLGLSAHDLASIGAEIGADVPFLVHGGSTIVEGIGDKLEPQEILPDLHAVIAFPEASCDTGAVYAGFDELALENLNPSAVRELAVSPPNSMPHEKLFNDLTAAALHITPALKDEMDCLESLVEFPVHLSGSGSSLFVICEGLDHASSMAELIERQLQLPAVAVRTVQPNTC